MADRYSNEGIDALLSTVEAADTAGRGSVSAASAWSSFASRWGTPSAFVVPEVNTPAAPTITGTPNAVYDPATKIGYKKVTDQTMYDSLVAKGEAYVLDNGSFKLQTTSAPEGSVLYSRTRSTESIEPEPAGTMSEQDKFYAEMRAQMFKKDEPSALEITAMVSAIVMPVATLYMNYRQQQQAMAYQTEMFEKQTQAEKDLLFFREYGYWPGEGSTATSSGGSSAPAAAGPTWATLKY